MDPKKAKEFSHRLDRLAKSLEKNRDDLAKQVDNVTAYLSRLVNKDQLTPGAYRRITSALHQL